MRLLARIIAAALVVVALAACAPVGPARAPASRFRMRQVKVPGVEEVRAPVAVEGQLVPAGPDGLVYPFHGERRLDLRRQGRRLLVNGRTVGLDLTEASREEALRLLQGTRGLSLLVWRRVARLDPLLLGAARRAAADSLVLVLGQSILASRPLDTGALAPLGDRLTGLVVEGDVSGEALGSLARFAGLRALSLRGALGPGALGHLGRLRQLRFLDLSGALRAFGPGAEGLAPLAGLARLVGLDLADNGLTDSEVAALGRLERLQWLRLAGNPLSGRTLGALAGRSPVRYLDLARTRLTSTGLARLTGFDQLAWLGLGHTAVSERGRQAFLGIRPQVKLLDESGAITAAPAPPGRPPGRPGAMGGRAALGEVVSRLDVGRSSAPAAGPLGVPACDAYLALLRCYFGALPAASRGPGLRALKSIRSSFLAQKRSLGARAATVLGSACTQAMQNMKQSIGRVPAAQKCLRP